MKTALIATILVFSMGCANLDVGGTAGAVVAAHANSAVFGGTVSWAHDPKHLAREEVNRTGRREYNRAQDRMRQAIEREISDLY